MPRGGRQPYIVAKNVELTLVRILQSKGYLAVRAPASGKAKTIFYPDVIAVKHVGSCHRVLIFDVKYRAARVTILYPRDYVWELARFARMAGADPYIAVYVAGERQWLVMPFTVLEPAIEEGVRHYRLPRSAYDQAMSLETVVESNECTPKIITALDFSGIVGGQASD